MKIKDISSYKLLLLSLFFLYLTLTIDVDISDIHYFLGAFSLVGFLATLLFGLTNMRKEVANSLKKKNLFNKVPKGKKLVLISGVLFFLILVLMPYGLDSDWGTILFAILMGIMGITFLAGILSLFEEHHENTSVKKENKEFLEDKPSEQRKPLSVETKRNLLYGVVLFVLYSFLTGSSITVVDWLANLLKLVSLFFLTKAGYLWAVDTERTKAITSEDIAVLIANLKHFVPTLLGESLTQGFAVFLLFYVGNIIAGFFGFCIIPGVRGSRPPEDTTCPASSEWFLISLYLGIFWAIYVFVASAYRLLTAPIDELSEE